MTTRKAFVLLSGGIDSTTCLYAARRQYSFEEIEAVSIDYGQRHKKEIEHAKTSAYRVGADHVTLPIGDVLNPPGTMLTDTGVEIPNISYSEIEGVSPTYVPFRNGTLLSVITARAQAWVNQSIEEKLRAYSNDKEIQDDMRSEVLRAHRDSAGIFFGAHADDAENWAYPDCTPEFIGAMANAIYVGTYFTCRLYTPIMWMTKGQVISYGQAFHVPWEDTWSCYKGDELQCGTCPTCQSRREGFREANLLDPTEYAN